MLQDFFLILKYVEFKNGLALHGVVGSQPIAFVPDGPRVSLEDDFMRLYPKKSIQQLNETKEDEFFIVMAIVTGVVDDGEWWYTACKWHQVVTLDSGLYYYDSCSGVGISVINGGWRFMVESQKSAIQIWRMVLQPMAEAMTAILKK